MRGLIIAVSILAGSTVSGCDELLDLLGDAGAYDAGAQDAGPPVDVAGTWTLSGTGRLRDCDDDRFETESLRLSATLAIRQHDEALMLDGARPVPGGSFGFEEARVREDRVAFTTLEEGADGRIRLRFTGAWDSLVDEIAGRFEGTGPGTCVASGLFTIAIAR